MNKAVQKVKEHLFWASVGFAVLVAGITWTAFEILRISPMRDRIDFLEDQITALRSDSNSKTSLKLPTSSEQTPHIIKKGTDNARTYLLNRPRNLVSALAGLSSRDSYSFQQKTYAEKWIHLEGPIQDISEMDGFGALHFIVDGQLTNFSLNDDQIPKLAKLQVGDKVSVEGKFIYASPERVEFVDSEILQ